MPFGSRRILAALLALQQLTFAVPGNAVVLQAGLPVDASAIALHGRNRALPVASAPYTGDSSYRIPILAPPGTGGLTPRVALAYSSGRTRQAGPLGVGWFLDIGPAVIERSTRDGAPEYDDALDAFELAGQRLRETATAGRYVKENHDFSRIQRITGASEDYWRVLRPDGTRLYYGFHPGADPSTGSVLSNVEVRATDPTPAVCSDPFNCGPAREVIQAGGAPFAWYLDRIEDRNGNVVRLTWQDLGDPGMRYLTEIRYSEHVGGLVSEVPSFGGSDDASLTRMRTINFQYEDTRADILPTYRTGFPRQITGRLAQIDVQVDSDLVRRYVLEYERSPASGRSRLTVVRERDTSGSATNQRVHAFSYGDGGEPDPQTGTFWSVKDSTWDLPGALVFVYSGTDTGIRIVDVNADGYPDVFKAEEGAPRNTYLGRPVEPGHLGGFKANPPVAWRPRMDLQDGTGFTGAVFADINGDGRPDIVHRRIEITGFNEDPTDCHGVPWHLHHEVVSGTQGVFIDNRYWVNNDHGWGTVSVTPSAVRYTDTTSLWIDADSCPYEYLPFSDRLTRVDQSFDQGLRVADINGDGLDDFLHNRRILGLHADGSRGIAVDEVRAGTFLNSPAGFHQGVRNFRYEEELANTASAPSTGFPNIMRLYDLPEWQIPRFNSPIAYESRVAWSRLKTCNATSNTIAEAFSGRERIVDLNGDGLPDILERIETDEAQGGLKTFERTLINHGYGWKPPSLDPETDLRPPLLFLLFTIGKMSINGGSCELTTPGQASDYGARLIDVNGDGGPDALGGGAASTETHLWAADAPNDSFWTRALAWETPVGFGEDNGPANGSRFADVNNDGMVDILVSDGAYLNVGEPPDMLETLTTPHGAVTDFFYEPHTVFGPAPESNPTVDGQYVHPHARWVLTRTETDPGPEPGQQPPVIVDFEYYDPTYDIEDRAFRGFREVVTIGPLADGVQRVTEDFYHTSDALRGQLAESVVSSVEDLGGPSEAWTTLTEVYRDYAHASGGDSSATVTYGDGSPDGTLADLGDTTITPAAFTAFHNLMNGSPDASAAFLAFPVQETVEQHEGQDPSSALSAQTRSRFDVYGNLRELVRRGDAGNPNDDITATWDYAIVDAADRLLANLPYQVQTSGVQGGLPEGTNLVRRTEYLYDGASVEPSSQIPVRGNPTAVRTAWTDPDDDETFSRVDRAFDVYGNVIEVSSPYENAALPAGSPESFRWITYDTASQTFPTQHKVGVAGDTTYDLVTTFEYETTDCGAPADSDPPGLGLVCKVTDPNSQVITRKYDAFGRLASATGPNGAAVAMLYHDSDLGTTDQRTEARIRWDPSGPSDPATDDDAIALVTYYDGLGRTLHETRSGRGSDVAHRFLEYDAAGRLAEISRWDYNGLIHKEPKTFAYDAVGRLLSETRTDGTVLTLAYTPREVTATTTLNAVPTHKRAVRVDAHGRLAEVDEYEDPCGSATTTSYAHDPFGALAAIQDSAGNRTEILYDELGSRVALDDPDAGVLLLEPDARGLVGKSKDARGKVQTYTYDPLGRLERRHAENPTYVEADDAYTYGLEGTTVPNGRGRLIRVDDKEGYDEFEYDVAGNIAVHRRSVLRRLFQFTRTYGPVGRVLTTVYPDLEMVTWHYDGPHLQRISSSAGPDDYVADVTWDALGRPLVTKLGNDATDPVMTTTHQYESISGRLDVLEATVDGSTVAKGDYGIDGAGRLTSLSYDTRPVGGGPLESGSVSSIAYDGLDRLTSAGSFTWDYDALGNLVEKDLDGTTGFSELRYDDPERPHALTFATSSDASRTLSFLYDAAGNVTRKTRTGDHGAPGAGVSTVSLAYDSLGRILRTRSSTGLLTLHRFGALGQRLGVSQRGTTGDANADFTVGAPDYSKVLNEFGNACDLDPNLSCDADFDGDLRVGGPDFSVVLSQFGSRFEHNSVLVPEPGFEYQPGLGRVNKHFFVAGRRVASSATSWTAPYASVAPAPVAGWRGPELPDLSPWALGAVAGALLSLGLLGFALRPGSAGPGRAPLPLRLGSVGTLLLVSPALLASPCGVGPPPVTSTLGTHAQGLLFYATDHLGGTIVAVDGAGAVTTRFHFMPFGDPGAVEEGEPLRHRFIGGTILEESGLYALGPRLYDPEVGRFLSPDPLVASPADPQALNRYSYALNNPLSWADPTGLQSESGSGGGGWINPGISPYSMPWSLDQHGPIGTRSRRAAQCRGAARARAAARGRGAASRPTSLPG